MAVRRRATQMTFRGLKRRIERDEKRDMQRTLGRWWGVFGQVSETVTGTNYAVNYKITTPSNNGIEIYGMDLVIQMRFEKEDAGPSNYFASGALMVCHVREGQSYEDFLTSDQAVPVSAGWDDRARPRAFIPLALNLYEPDGGESSSQYATIVIPYRFFRGRRIRLLDSEELHLVFALYDTSRFIGNTLKMQVSGRYRYIVKSQN